jgi:hypothetical protein
MKRIIFSFYIDIPKDELDIFDGKLVRNGYTPINYVTKDAFKEHYIKLIACKEWYANQIGVPFRMFEYNENFRLYKENLQRKYPYLTTYNIVNFYKIHLLCSLSKEYDEILYLDFDVVPMKSDNFFETWDLSKGIAIQHNTHKVVSIEAVTQTSQTIRSPTAKYYNAQAMLIDRNLNPKHHVVNTGIVGASKKHLEQLKYFDNFDSDMNEMSNLTTGHDLFPKSVTDIFGWDNETLFAVKLAENNVDIQWLDNKWHYFFSGQGYVPKETVLCHAINKRFDIVWRAYDRND